MIGYKATYNGKCLNQLYEVGKTYTLDGELFICIRGFHFCKDLYNVFEYYPPNKNLKVFKVEALGSIETEYDKSVTDKIKILEEIDLSNMVVEKYNKKKHFDGKGNLIKYEDSDGSWERYEYDLNGNRTKREDSYGRWVRCEYDSNNNLTKHETDNGWEKNEYDENNNLTKHENSNGYWYKNEYDLNNNLIKYESSNNFCMKYEYNENNKCIKEERSDGNWKKYKYDENNKCIKEEYSGDYW